VEVAHLRATGGGEKSGQALVEFALVAPLLVLLLTAIFQFAFVFQAQMGLTNAVREAARRAAATTPSDESSLDTWAQDQLVGSGGDPGLLASNVQAYSVTRLSPNPPAVTLCTYTINGLKSQMMNVTATYNYPVFFPLLLAFATGNPDWTLSASAQMRLENPLATDPAKSC
jgi:Flp pilus assembly protein TadG